MSEQDQTFRPLVGVASFVTAGADSLKRHALMFDRLLLSQLNRVRIIAESARCPPGFPTSADLDYLENQDVFYQAPARTESNDVDDVEVDARISRHFREYPRTPVEFAERIREKGPPATQAELGEWNQLFAREADSLCRLTSARVNTNRTVRAVPILAEPITPLDLAVSTDAEVVEVVLSSLPTPDQMTAWEQIIEFRRDDRVRAFYSDIRTWINRSVVSGLSARELAGEIEATVHRYESYLREYRIAKTMTRLETVIQGGAVGVVAGIGLGEVAAVAGAVGSIAVTLRRRRAELMQAEMSAPGHELAFISKARGRFGR